MGETNSFSSDFFKGNRTQLRTIFEGSAPIVLTANSYIQKTTSEQYPYRQDSSFWYFTGINEPGYVLVLESNKEYLIAPEHDPVMAMFDGEPDIDSLQKKSGIEKVYEHTDGWQRLEKRVKKSKHVATIQPSPAYIERYDMFTNPSRARLVSRLLELNEELDMIDLSQFVQKLRMVKQEPEVSAIKTASDMTVKVLKNIDKKLSKFTTERDVDAFIKKAAIDLGADFSFESVVASGKNTATIHYRSAGGSISPDSPLMIDMGLMHDGYCADLTRTFCREPSERFGQVYESVRSAHQFALSLLKPGVDLHTYEQAVRHYIGEKLRELGLISTITEEALMQYNPTKTSHFLGIDVHDVGDYEATLVPGMVLTVEPGIYIANEGIGIRIEDDVLITEKGHQVLSAQLPVSSTSLTI